MAQSLALMDSVEEGLMRGVKKVQDDSHTSARQTGTYDTFKSEEGDRYGGGHQLQDQEVKRTTGRSLGALFRFLACALHGKEEPEESWPLTERHHTTPSVGCSSQLTRYLPRVMKGASHQVKQAGMWVVEGLRDYVSSGGYYFIHDATPSVTQISLWESRF